jgi:choline kinase
MFSLELFENMMKKRFCIIFKNKATSCFSTFMTEKKSAKKTVKKATEKKSSDKTKAKPTKAKAAKTKSKKQKEEPSDDMGIVIVDDDIAVDQEKINEERRAYLEEARSQEAYD